MNLTFPGLVLSDGHSHSKDNMSKSTEVVLVTNSIGLPVAPAEAPRTLTKPGPPPRCCCDVS